MVNGNTEMSYSDILRCVNADQINKLGRHVDKVKNKSFDKRNVNILVSNDDGYRCDSQVLTGR
jgi:hypothetical protein